MKVQKSKHTLFYNLGLLFIGVLFLYVLISHDAKGLFTFSTLFLMLSGAIAGIRAFLIDRFRRLINNKEIVNFWKYFDDADIGTIIVDYFKILPILQRLNEIHLDKLRKRINLLTGMFYMTFSAFIWTQLGRGWHYL